MIQQLFWLLLSLFRQLLHILKSFFVPPTTITFDENNLSVIIQSKIAEGGFSYIYSVHDKQFPTKKYALKRIICPDEDTILACRKEAKVHRTLGNSHEHVLPLIAIKFEKVSTPTQQTICYMLFPLIEGGSLRDEINRRNLLSDTPPHMQNADAQPRPMSEYQVLNIFSGILQAVLHMHNCGLAHYDIKPENILLESFNPSTNTNNSIRDEEIGASSSRYNPILMDFGSAKSLVTQLSNRRVILALTEEASRNSTVTYRAPELFEGGCRHGETEANVDGKVDVWSCGCLLYSIMYGTSPFEMDFRQQDGSVKIVECTHLGVLGGKIPVPPRNSEVGSRYRKELFDLVQWILKVERTERPSIEEVLDKVEGMLGSHSISNTWKKSNEYDGLL